MKTISIPKEMQKMALDWRVEGKKIAFVPTMGALHDGHVSLVRKARELADIVVVSIFVNPMQFGPKEDLNKYPCSPNADTERCKIEGVDVIFLPSDEIMYGGNYQTYVEVKEVTKGLCGASRPTHFRGVTTVVLKLFNIVLPHISIFGEKDYQQLATIKQMVRDLNIPVEIIGAPTVREKDGLAMSSRNIYLSPHEREAACFISRSMKMAIELVSMGEHDTKKISRTVKEIVESTKILKVDYVKICHAETLEELEVANTPARLLISAFAGNARLIDNCQLL